MAKITFYKNSKLATAFSIIGYLLIIAGIYFLFNDYAVVGIILLVVGILAKLLAVLINNKKSKKEE